MPVANQTRLKLLISVLLAAVTLACYWQVGRNDFIGLDDPDYVTENAMVKAGLTREGAHWAFTRSHSSNWHPVTWLSHMLDCQLFGVNAREHHLVNLGLHVANTIVLFLLLLQLTGAIWRSAFVAGLFALHPAHVESVAWVAERKDLLSAWFGFLTLMAYTRYAKATVESRRPGDASAITGNAGRDRVLFYLLALALFSLGLMSKPMLVTWPFVMLLLDGWPLCRFEKGGFKFKTLARLSIEKIPFLLLAIGSCLLTLWAQGRWRAIASVEQFPLWYRGLNALASYGGYLGKMFWPTDLAVFYPFQKEVPYLAASLSAAGLILVSTLAVWWRKSRGYASTGWFWYLGTLVPVIGIVQVGGQAMADRYTYLPYVGLFIILSWGMTELISRWQFSRAAAALMSVIVLIAIATLSVRQVQRWRSTETLFQHTHRVTQKNFLALTVLAGFHQRAGDVEKALALYKEALAMAPDYPRAWSGAGLALRGMGKTQESLVYLKHASEIAPADREIRDDYGVALLLEKDDAGAEAQFLAALDIDPHYAEVHWHYALALQQLGRSAEALEHFEAALRYKPQLTRARTDYAFALSKARRFEQAVPQLQQLLLDDQTNQLVLHLSLGGALIELARFDQAREQFSAALRLSSTNSAALDGMGYALAMQGRVDEAFPFFTNAVAASPTNSFAQAHLAMSLQRGGQMQEAVQHFRLALKSDPNHSLALNNLAWLLATYPDAKLRDGTEAVTLGERLSQSSGHGEPLFLGTLAAAYAEAGRFTNAIATAEKARDIARSNKLESVAQKNESLLELYRAGKPYREAPQTNGTPPPPSN